MGDDLLVTDPAAIRLAAERRVANAALLKPNQIGTVTETLPAIETARLAGYARMVSHRSGETTDTCIANLGSRRGGITQVPIGPVGGSPGDLPGGGPHQRERPFERCPARPTISTPAGRPRVGRRRGIRSSPCLLMSAGPEPAARRATPPKRSRASHRSVRRPPPPRGGPFRLAASPGATSGARTRRAPRRRRSCRSGRALASRVVRCGGRTTGSGGLCGGA